MGEQVCPGVFEMMHLHGDIPRGSIDGRRLLYVDGMSSALSTGFWFQLGDYMSTQVE